MPTPESKSVPETVSASDLPPLPKMLPQPSNLCGGMDAHQWYTSDQMRQYARDAIALATPAPVSGGEGDPMVALERIRNEFLPNIFQFSNDIEGDPLEAVNELSDFVDSTLDATPGPGSEGAVTDFNLYTSPMGAGEQTGEVEPVGWPSLAKRAGNGDWIARTPLCSHTMSEAQAELWNACLAACGRAVIQQASALAQARADTRRMDWLERQHVKVRENLRYGSRDLFAAYSDDQDGEGKPSDLRARIDTLLASGGEGGE